MAIKFVLKQNLSETSAENNPTLGEYLFDGDMFTVGKDAANHLVLPEGASEQAVIVREGEILTLINSADGTKLNNQTLRREAIQPLAVGDEINIGNFIISVVEDQMLSRFQSAPGNIPAINQNLNDTETKNGTFPLPETTNQSEEHTDKPPVTRNFAEILDTLRTEEDSFYFVIKDENGESGRVPLEQAEIPIGANGKGKIAFAAEQISTIYAVARKDWSGILLESQRRNSVYVNDEAIETTRRLRNDDRVSFAAPTKYSLVLHEPSSLVALESLLSARVASNGTRFGGLAANNNAATENALPAENQNVPIIERRYFNYFSFFEIVTMIIGTLIGTVLFFLFFEFMFS